MSKVWENFAGSRTTLDQTKTDFILYIFGDATGFRKELNLLYNLCAENSGKIIVQENTEIHKEISSRRAQSDEIINPESVKNCDFFSVPYSGTEEITPVASIYFTRNVGEKDHEKVNELKNKNVPVILAENRLVYNIVPTLIYFLHQKFSIFTLIFLHQTFYFFTPFYTQKNWLFFTPKNLLFSTPKNLLF